MPGPGAEGGETDQAADRGGGRSPDAGEQSSGAGTQGPRAAGGELHTERQAKPGPGRAQAQGHTV